MNLNTKLPSYLLGKYQLIGTMTFAVLFAVVFLNIYIPFSKTAWFRLGDSIMFLRTLLFVAVSICILIVSRILMYQSKKSYEMTFTGYIFWCVMEILVIAGFYTWTTLDIAPPADETHWDIFQRALIYSTISLGIPYLIAGMYFAIIDKNNTIRLMSYENIVNIKKVSMLHKESDGYVLELSREEIPPISVTKTYTDIVLSHFTGESPLLEPIDY